MQQLMCTGLSVCVSVSAAKVINMEVRACNSYVALVYMWLTTVIMEVSLYFNGFHMIKIPYRKQKDYSSLPCSH